MIWYITGFFLILHIYLWGLGLTLLILPRRWRRFWPAFCAPVGLALQSAVVWIGTHTPLPGTDSYARASLVLPVALLAAAVAVRRPAGAWRLLAAGRRWWVVVLIMTFSLTLQTYPFTRPPRVLTSIAMTSLDAADYAAGARVFKEFAHDDRTGYLGVKESPWLGVDTFYDFWLRINHFTPSALIALDASIFQRQPYELTTLFGVVLLTLHLPGVFWLARSTFRFGPVGSFAVTLLYGVSPVLYYAMYQVALGQLLATPAVALLTWTGVQAFRGPGTWRRYVGYSGLLLTGNWLLLGGYNFFLLFAFVPAVAYAGLCTLMWGKWMRAWRWLGFIVANLLVASLLAPARALSVVQRFFLFSKTPFGWPIPGFYPSGWYGAFSDIYLHPAVSMWIGTLGYVCLAALVAALIWPGRRGTAVLAAACTLPIFFGYWLLLREDRQLHDNASYDAYKLFTIFYPGILLSLCLWVRAAAAMGRGPRVLATALWLAVLAVSLAGSARFNTFVRLRALRVDAPLASISKLENAPGIDSVNVAMQSDWERIWGNYFLLRKPQFFSRATYEGRPITPALGQWDLDESPPLVSAHFAGERNPLQGNPRFIARDRLDGRFLAVQLDTGWYAMETLGGQFWCWTGGPAQLAVVNPHAGNVDSRVSFALRDLHDRDVRLCIGDRCLWAGKIGVNTQTIRDVPLSIPPGTTRLRFESPEPADHVAGDSRALAFALYHLTLDVPANGGFSPMPPAPLPPIAPQAYRIMRAVEDAHWWFDGMETITRRLLQPMEGSPTMTILDAGCGTGRNLRFLGGYGTVTGLDFSQVPLDCCRVRVFERLVRGSVNALPFAAASFDLVTSFDVLTSQGVDDRAALRAAARVLRPGGWFLVRVAAYDWLRSRHDLEWAITHRYTRAELCAKLVAAGFEVRQASYANTWLFPVALLKRWSERWFPPRAGESDLQLGARRSPGTSVLRFLLASEARWVAGGGLPFGLSLIALARKGN